MYSVIGFFGAALFGSNTEGNVLQNNLGGGAGQGVLNMAMSGLSCTASHADSVCHQPLMLYDHQHWSACMRPVCSKHALLCECARYMLGNRCGSGTQLLACVCTVSGVLTKAPAQTGKVVNPPGG